MARQIVLRQLTMQARSRHELAEILRKKGIPGEAATAVLDRMTEVGLVDDARFAEAWVDSRQQRRHLSRAGVRQELQRKGLDRDLVNETVAEIGSDDEYAAAHALAEKKLRSVRNLEPVVQRRRIAGALARRGFGPGIANQVLTDVLDTDPAEFD
ncbi:recombination regulator RecX [Enemella evansiae]|uniref:regulatory protein RecX n=1 Tax=Enemella evansiae TaxID=2016499 RepID=UPI000B976E79|nr:regulatory protein RecX [Enemella evansiae]OYO15227.1 recombination regulator RecX [Enemella evansiae]